MSRRVLLAYQLITGLTDSLTGALLIVAPALTLHLMGLDAPAAALPYLSLIGAFVLAMGLSCLYGALLLRRPGNQAQMETVWVLTAFMRSSVAVFVGSQILSSALEPGWLTVAVIDAACVAIQAVGLRRGWLRNAA